MKELRSYIMSHINEAKNINEAKDDVEVRDLIVKYSCPDDLYIQVPEKYGESDIQIYLDDTLLDKLPAETQENALGKNADNIVDCFFEYEKMDPSSGISQKSDIEWDESYDQSLNGTNMVVQHIKGMKYVIKFDKFYINGIDENDEEEIKDTIYNLFNGFTEDANDELPFDITLDKDNIEFKQS